MYDKVPDKGSGPPNDPSVAVASFNIASGNRLGCGPAGHAENGNDFGLCSANPNLAVARHGERELSWQGSFPFQDDLRAGLRNVTHLAFDNRFAVGPKHNSRSRNHAAAVFALFSAHATPECTLRRSIGIST